jgi:hypothetical protein
MRVGHFSLLAPLRELVEPDPAFPAIANMKRPTFGNQFLTPGPFQCGDMFGTSFMACPAHAASRNHDMAETTLLPSIAYAGENSPVTVVTVVIF